MPRPGIMVYFDMMGPLSKLPDADKGRLFWAMLEYGKFGIVPEFSDLSMSLAWEFVKPKLDKDLEEYNRTVLKRRYAAFCRDRKKTGEPEISFDEWCKVYDDRSASMMTVDNQNDHVVSHDSTWYPTTTTTTSTTTSTTTAAARTTTGNDGAATAADTDSQLQMWGGELGRGVVALTDAQAEILLNKMGQEVFDHYVANLAGFIIRNGAQVKSHYATILKWWMEDSQTEGGG